jgi:hypothetical protein
MSDKTTEGDKKPQEAPTPQDGAKPQPAAVRPSSGVYGPSQAWLDRHGAG